MLDVTAVWTLNILLTIAIVGAMLAFVWLIIDCLEDA
jgi:hypothetical protein